MDQTYVTVLSSLLEVGGISAFFMYVIKGLKSKIDSLNETINVQKDTLKAMESRIDEVQKIGDTYKKFAEELPEYVENYEKIVKATKDRAINHLENEVKLYQERLEQLSKLDESFTKAPKK
ncbi:Phosphoserine phosphatase [Vibrio chagasii]|nr:Phosphoserine phosphatase [Vibrio chagasii]CAH7095807.1 Phosphoserine phosphatase [Vibrio chagasii]CAH7204208.1 Phosphoserine phosphatase [Vibrio chagasii]CAH7292290.1 Phosphoserine phosphatase [Vibrio chagasii]